MTRFTNECFCLLKSLFIASSSDSERFILPVYWNLLEIYWNLLDIFGVWRDQKTSLNGPGMVLDRLTVRFATECMRLY
jgi:hypothetical protein